MASSLFSTIGQIRANVPESRLKKRKKSSSSSVNNTAGSGRHVKWQAGQAYICTKESSTVFQSVKDIDKLYQDKLVSEECFSIYKNADPNVSRNETIPLYEAVYKCANGMTYKVQKKHLKMAYINANKLDNTKAWTFVEKDVPYWVDRFIFTRLANKRK